MSSRVGVTGLELLMKPSRKALAWSWIQIKTALLKLQQKSRSRRGQRSKKNRFAEILAERK
jgi:hypothetical protein